MGTGINYWPLAVLLLLLVLLGGFIWYREQAWKRQIQRTLREIKCCAASGAVQSAWLQMALLLRKIALHLRGPGIAGMAGQNWLLELDDIFQTTQFSDGCGRGVLSYPYRAINDEGAMAQNSRGRRQSNKAHADPRTGELLELIALLSHRSKSLQPPNLKKSLGAASDQRSVVVSGQRNNQSSVAERAELMSH